MVVDVAMVVVADSVSRCGLDVAMVGAAVVVGVMAVVEPVA